MYKEQVFMEGTTSPRAPGSAFSQMCPLKALHTLRVPLQIKTLKLAGPKGRSLHHLFCRSRRPLYNRSWLPGCSAVPPLLHLGHR